MGGSSRCRTRDFEMTPSRIRLVGAVFAATLALLTAIAAPRASADEAPPASTAPATQSQAIEAEKKDADAAADKAKVLGPAQIALQDQGMLALPEGFFVHAAAAGGSTDARLRQFRFERAGRPDRSRRGRRGLVGDARVREGRLCQGRRRQELERRRTSVQLEGGDRGSERGPREARLSRGRNHRLDRAAGL